jgi:hypothetical protein
MINDAGKYEVKNSRRTAAGVRREPPGSPRASPSPSGHEPSLRHRRVRPARSNKETTVSDKNINVLSWGGAETER